MSSLNNSIIKSATEIAPLNQILFEYEKQEVTIAGETYFETNISDCACYLNTKISLVTAVSGTIFIDYYQYNKKSSPPVQTESIPFGPPAIPAAVFYFFTRPIASFYIRVRLLLDSDPALEPIPAHRQLCFFVINVKH